MRDETGREVKRSEVSEEKRRHDDVATAIDRTSSRP